MKVTIRELSEATRENRDYKGYFSIDVDGVKKVTFMDGEPEDATISRDFNDVYNIPDLMKLSYEAGKNGETFEIKERYE